MMLRGQQDAMEQPRTDGINEVDQDEDEPVARGRPRRAAQQNRIKVKTFARKRTEGYDSLGSMDDESDATSSGNEWEGGDEDEVEDHIDDEEEDEDVDISDNSMAQEEDDDPRQSLVVSLRYTKSRLSSPSQESRIGPTAFKDHITSLMTINNSKGPSEMASSTDKAIESLNNVPKPTRPSLHSPRALPTEHTAPGQYATLTDPQPQVSHSGQSMPFPPEKDLTSIRPEYSPSEEHATPAVSWPRSETGVVASNGPQM